MVIHATSSCPQKGVLSSFLWSITVGLFWLSWSVIVLIEYVVYADNVVITARGKFDVTISGIMNNTLKLDAYWCLESGLSVNPAKTSLAAFSRKRNLNLRDSFVNEKLICSTDVNFFK